MSKHVLSFFYDFYLNMETFDSFTSLAFWKEMSQLAEKFALMSFSTSLLYSFNDHFCGSGVYSLAWFASY